MTWLRFLIAVLTPPPLHELVEFNEAYDVMDDVA